MSKPVLMIWPDNVMASARSVRHRDAFLYAARRLVHDLLRSVAHMVGGPLRLGARWRSSTASAR